MDPRLELVSDRTKRTYNLTPATIRRVREIAERYGSGATQDSVVEHAVERLYLEEQGRAERDLWAKAATDPEFIGEARDLADRYDDPDAWPV